MPKKTGPKRQGRRTGVHVERKPKMFYYVDGGGQVREKRPKEKGPGRPTGKRVQRSSGGGFLYVDGQGEVRELERASASAKKR
jgi:hypothetical protein